MNPLNHRTISTSAAVIGLVLLAALGVHGAVAPEPEPWQCLAPGLDLARFPVDDATVSVLRIDPDEWQTVALAASELGDGNRSVRSWGRRHGFAATINAGMYAAEDHLTHTGYFHTGEHINNGVWNQRDYRQAACFEPREPGLPRFALQDLDAHPESTFVHRYNVVIQNLRLIRKPRENRWSPQSRRWSEACLAEDTAGRALWIYCPEPNSMHALNELLLALPLDIVAAQHLEGGPGAQLWVNPAGLDSMARHEAEILEREHAGLALPVPNVLGIKARGAP